MTDSDKSLKKRIKELEASVNALKINEEKFRQLWEYIPDAIFLTKIGGKDSGKILNANPAAASQTGYSIEQLIGMNIITSFPVNEEAVVLVNERENELLNGNLILFSEKKKRKDGSEYWTEVHIRNILVGGEYIALSVNRDITQWKVAEEALQKSEEKFRSFIENSGIGFVTDDRDGDITYFNKTFADIFGYSSDEIKGQSHKSLIHPDDLERIKKFHEKRIHGDNPSKQYEFRGIRKDGSIIIIEVSLFKVLKEEGEIIGTHSFLRDITERKLAEEEILKLKGGLEVQVAEKTKELNEKISELERFNKLFIGREFRIKELRGKIKKLETESKSKS